MRAGIYQIVCRFESETVLPDFKGSTIRGGLGHALKRITCALRRQDCASCLLLKTCAYAVLYEVQQGRPGKGPVAARPHPYVLVPPDDPKRQYHPGDTFTFGLLLFGPTVEYLPHVVFAILEMGKAGLGKRTSDGAGRFQLQAVYQNDQAIYDGATLSPIPPNLIELMPPGPPVDRITLTCLTPLRLKYTNQLQNSLPFHLLIRAALRRVSSLESAYGDGEPPLDYRGLAARAADVAAENADCRWTDIERYSARQKTAMSMGGITGSISYRGDLNEFLPLLRYCETTHLGKQTSFGLGCIQVSAGKSS